ncbi:MAG: glycoside hydrolase family 68 protein [Vicinamibacterales bacterium]
MTTPETPAPLIDASRVPKIMPGYHLWDFWPVMEWDESARIARIDGWYVVIPLTEPADLVPEARHDVATHRMLVSPDGMTWRDGGAVYLPGTALGSRRWAASAYYDENAKCLMTYYTAAGRSESAGLSFEQWLAMTDAAVTVTGAGLAVSDWSAHRVILEADGEWYGSTFDTSAQPGMIDAFSEPKKCQLAHFGGTVAPTLTIALDGARTRLAGEEYGLVLEPDA